MSDLQRSFAKAKLSHLPFNPPRPLNVLEDEAGYFDEELEEEDSLKPLPSPSGGGGGSGAHFEDDEYSSASSASSVSSAGTIIPSPSQRLFARGKVPQTSTSRYAPLPWTDFFAQELYLTSALPPTDITYHVYLTPPSPCNSGGNGPLFVMHHGAGSSGLSFANVTSHLLRQLPSAGVLALDARGHGETSITPIPSSTSSGPSTSSPTSLDLSLGTLSTDLSNAWTAVRSHMGWTHDVPVILVGHSLGGAVVATVAKENMLPGAKILGFAVLDVVEGSAMDALQSMTAYLATRPKSFAGVEEGVEWHMRSRTIRNTTSARASVPALLRPEKTLAAAAPPPPPSFSASYGVREKRQERQTSRQNAGETRRMANGNSEQGDDDEADGDDAVARQRWTWRTDLAATQPFWENWFVGLSSKFLGARGGKLLLLAGTDRLDKELMIGQMQGKYQLQVFPEAGHFVHEDAPEKTATVLVDFWKRNDGSRLVLPPKVGDLLKMKEKGKGGMPV